MNQKNAWRSDGANDVVLRLMAQPCSWAAAPIALWRTVMAYKGAAAAKEMARSGKRKLNHFIVAKFEKR